MPAKFPVTLAIRALRTAQVAFEPHPYPWEAHGGTAHSAAALGVDEHAVVKTLIFEDDQKQPLCVLMHGDREVSAKQLARLLGKRSVAPCRPEVADRHSGYQVGGTSPFGLRRAMPVYMERTILDCPTIYIKRRRTRLPRRHRPARGQARAFAHSSRRSGREMSHPFRE